MRLIDADKLPKYNGCALSANEVAMAVENAPTVDAEPVCHGRWLKHGYSCPCSNCGYDLGYSGTPMELTLAFFKYCPNCGAKMDGGET